jgi:hypothetical protein
MNLPCPFILLADSDANFVAYILLIAGPLLGHELELCASTNSLGFLG